MYVYMLYYIRTCIFIYTYKIGIDTLPYQDLLFCRVPINTVLGFIIRTYKKVGFGSLR